MIIGTAGHIDHGKSALVRALTGVQTDRLAAEKERGISIELGYAYLPIPDHDEILGFIDVPGHEALIHTMVAGATGMRFAMLVVAADDGAMPQTHEHIAILELLGIERGCVVITKSDTVDASRLEQVKSQLTNILQNTFLATSPIFAVNSLAPEDEGGIDALRQYLFEQAVQIHALRAQGPFRLAVDRSFTLSGHGTVVTGTVFGGHLDLQQPQAERLRIMPAGIPVRARRIHAQDQPSSTARVGQRCAVNIAGVGADDIQRGQWLAEEYCFEPTRRIDVEMHMLASSQTELRTWSPAHIHIGAAHHHAHCVPLTTHWVQPNDRALVQLVFDEPVCVLPGDRFIVRDAQARHTIAGGRVLDVHAPDRKRRSQKRIDWLESMNAVLQGADIEQLLVHAPYGFSRTALNRLPTETRWAEQSAPEGCVWVGPEGEPQQILIAASIWAQLEKDLLTALAWAHQRYPDDPGVERARLRRMVAPRAPDVLWDALLTHLQQQGQLHLNGAWYHLPDHTVSLSADEDAYAEQIMTFAWEGRYNPPWIRDIAKELSVDEQTLRSIGRKLVRQGRLFQVVRDLFYHREHVIDLALLLKELAADSGVRVATYRDHINVGRKRTIQILEFFERIGFSRRVGDIHYLRKDSRFLDSI
ncbi:MAG TPA: selenocysteine-specific translation elongation factor [Paenalcaligenes sp.]|nr:selenocysteine-specific translation elongation factor [Paenalcaligenes sp.]